MQLPVEFCEEMKRILGDEYDGYLQSMGESRRFGLRVNTAKISVEEFLRISPFELIPIPYVDNGFFYDGDTVQPAKHPYYYAGLYYLQDPSAMTPASRLPIEEGDNVLDLCAAPGGKTTELAARLKGTGLLIANDISAKRARALLKNVELFGIENSFIIAEYAQKLGKYLEGFFDKILIDAPCSGEGMFRKDPAMIRAWEPGSPQMYADMQEDILRHALPMLKPGGMLLYSTCTFSPLEDEGTVEKILAMDSNMELIEMKGYEGFVQGKPELIGSTDESIRRCVRMFPHRLEGEGHFLALFRKKEDDGILLSPPTQSPSGLKGEERSLWENFAGKMKRQWDSHRMECKNGMVYYMPAEFPKMRGLHFLRSGLFVGEIKKNRFEPSQSLAMALSCEDFNHCLMLSVEDERVIRYLKGETIVLTAEESQQPDDWHLVCVEGYPLGWGKKTGQSLKNKYHKGWRMM